MPGRMAWLTLLVLAVAGCAQVSGGRFDALALGMSQAQVEEMLGRPQQRYERMWEYRLSGGEYGFVVFDRKGRVSAWLREEVPRLRSGLLPLSEETCRRLRPGTDAESLLVLLGEPARREGGRWHYPAPGGRELVLELSPEGKLVGKSWQPIRREVRSEEAAAEEAPARVPAEEAPSEAEPKAGEPAAAPPGESRTIELEAPSR